MTMKIALPDSGSNAATALAHLVAEMLGFTTRDRIRLIWGDTDIAPSSDEWFGGRTITLQGAAICSAADKLRKDLLAARGSMLLKVDAAKLQIRDGVISSTEDPKKSTTFAALVKANNGVIRQTGRGVAGGERGRIEQGRGRLLRRGRSGHLDRRLALCPGGLSRTTPGSSSIRWWPRPTWSDRWSRARRWRPTPFPGIANFQERGTTASAICPTGCRPSWTFPSRPSVYIDSLEPRWFYGVKSFSETSIGAVPGAISNAIYNACGVRIREHPITREKIMAGLDERKGGGHEERSPSIGRRPSTKRSRSCRSTEPKPESMPAGPTC